MRLSRPLAEFRNIIDAHAAPSPLLFYRSIRVPLHHGSIYDNKVGPLLNRKPRQLIPAHVSRLTSYIKAEGSASPWKHHQALITFVQHSSLHRPFRMGGTVYRLSACYLLFSCLIFTSSHFTLSIAQSCFSPSPISHGGE